MTAPLVPPDIVIPRLPWVPIYADRLWESNFFAVATDAEFKAAFCLWLKSWTQTPPGSLPNDDRVLCRLAELNGNLAKWGKVKRIALRHWIECDDGRLYHPVVAQLVIEAYQRLTKNRHRTAAATEARNVQRNVQRHGLRVVSNLNHDLDKPPLNPPREGGRDFFSINDEGLPSGNVPAVEPKIIGHSLPCDCSNCRRWVEQHRSAG
jgi:hypothetical protein